MPEDLNNVQVTDIRDVHEKFIPLDLPYLIWQIQSKCGKVWKRLADDWSVGQLHKLGK